MLYLWVGSPIRSPPKPISAGKGVPTRLTERMFGREGGRVGFNNPSVPWSELERRLSGVQPQGSPRVREATEPDRPEWATGGDGPAWSHKRVAWEPPTRLVAPSSTVPYAELHCHTNFSFLKGASHPEELVQEAVRLGLEALAVTDRNGFYGVVRFAEAARAVGLPTVFGAEIVLADRGAPLVVLARGPGGYARLARALSQAQMAGKKGAPRITLGELADLAVAPVTSPPHRASSPIPGGDGWVVLTGGIDGPLACALAADGPAAAARELDLLVEAFGVDSVHVELWDHGDPLDSHRNDALSELALRRGVGLVATNHVRHATPAGSRLAAALAAVGARRSLDDADGWLPAGSGAHLRSGAEQDRRFARYPGVVAAAAELGRQCAFDLALVAPCLPPYPCPDGLSEMAFLRRLVEEGASRVDRYGPRPRRRGDGGNDRAWAQIDHELSMIDQLGFPGYFLIVWDIVQFCRLNDIYCQGRGSAANSAACWALGITKVDAVGLGLLFERFLSPERDGPPDIDLDIESGRREEVIQYVYGRYGRQNAAQVANVITYRSRSSVRDMAKALGADPGQQDAWSKQLDPWKRLEAQIGEKADNEIPVAVLDLAREVEHFPRHLGIHSGGMVVCDRPVVEVCPVEWARMADRSVLQWDKDDCAAVGLVKFDLLGLGMLSALHHMVDLVGPISDDLGPARSGIDLATIPQDPEVYDMLCRADSVGVFQVESRAQMATLPRLRPRTFYDLVVEVALIRPGPIQGGSVHPYIRRRNGKEPVTYLHPLLERSLSKTLGIPLFQEQLMQMAIDVAGFSPSEADQLRQAMGSKRSSERMERLRQRLFEGMAERGITGDVAEEIYVKLAAFANYGFPESHSVSFAYLVYASAWFKYHYPAAFCAGLLNAQPMGFYSPHSLVADATRHGVEVRTPCVNASAATATLEPPSSLHPPAPLAAEEEAGLGRADAVTGESIGGDGVGGATVLVRDPSDDRTWGYGGPAVRLGIGVVRGIGPDLAERIAAGRPYASMEDVARRNPDLTLTLLESLATAGAFSCFRGADVPPGRAAVSGLDSDPVLVPVPGRREDIWAVGALAQGGPGHLEGIVTGVQAPTLPGMDERETAQADLWSTGIAAHGHPTRFVRSELDRLGVVSASDLAARPHSSRVLVGGVVTHRQRPATAGGTTFVNLEDETGLINVVVSKGCWVRHRRLVQSAPALLVRGRVESADGAVNVVAEAISLLPLAVTTTSRDFR
jgi:error-prone DNA polymerase